MGFVKRHPAVFLGLFIMLVFFALNVRPVEFLDSLDNKFYDIMMHVRGDFEGQSDVVLVEIDEQSIKRLGRWPWPRSILAKGVEKISEGKPRVIGLNVILSEPEISDGLTELMALQEMFSQIVGQDKETIDQDEETPSQDEETLDKDVETPGQDAQTPDQDKETIDKDEEIQGLGEETLAQDEKSAGQIKNFAQAMEEAVVRLDNDRTLEQALGHAGKVVLPVYFTMSPGAPVPEEPDEALYDVELPVEEIPYMELYPETATEITMPIERFFMVADGIGHINVYPELDGTVRSELMYFDGGQVLIPAYTLRLLWRYLGLSQEDVSTIPGIQITLKSRIIPIKPNGTINVSYKGGAGAFESYYFFEVLNGTVSPAIFKNKLVIVTLSAPGVGTILPTPVGNMNAGEFSANVIWAMLNEQFIGQPPWAGTAHLIFIFLIGLVGAFLLPRLKALWSALIFVVFFAGFACASGYLMVGEGVWMPVMYPMIQLLISYIGAVTIQYFMSETGMEKAKGESAETNRMLGLSFQNQGMLDMAFDKFRRVPVDGEVKDLLYNLALDFERKRQFNKAASVYEYIEEHDQKFKDVATRKTKLMQASETMVFGPGMLGGGGAMDTLISDGSDTKPTLGRYEVSKMLGKGAMGIVYLGKDPRINRTTAIKTVRFADDFQEEEAAEMKKKFFREAESAGTLSHPNIVTIYDAGEEQELAYIAMEYLEGGDMDDYIKPDKLLPMRKVIEYMADICDALDYAHAKGIVHRDIKPANIMLIKSGMVKITDFGIARITATSQTQTGVVKGTPYYMSPEQIAGKKVDGRSDIFSVGVMTYQLLTGKLPFHGDSVAALMHQIMNVEHPDPRKFNSKIPKPLVAIINKSLEKDREKRYLKAGQMMTHLRQLGQKIDVALAQKKNGE